MGGMTTTIWPDLIIRINLKSRLRAAFSLQHADRFGTRGHAQAVAACLLLGEERTWIGCTPRSEFEPGTDSALLPPRRQNISKPAASTLRISAFVCLRRNPAPIRHALGKRLTAIHRTARRFGILVRTIFQADLVPFTTTHRVSGHRIVHDEKKDHRKKA